ncbi:uncharacterized protein LOC142632978 [Castanea sativa]|uniref:uncharacterized protein LOC142632978 n=1 Tax=Castanea sativa TaxID=21020 RepID=UPI003F652092
MIVLSWNCQGLGNPWAVTVLSHLVREKAPDVLFLMETKHTVDEMKTIQAELHYDAMFAVPCIRRASGLAMLWKEHVDLHIQNFTQNHIDAHIRTNPSAPWRLTGFYGRPEEYRKHESWSLLRHLHTRDSLPWLCLGDFNEILSSKEKQGRLPRPLRLMEEFRSVLLHCELIDLGFNGNRFTWRNGGRGDAYVQERLDRACATINWRAIFPNSKLYHLQVAYSDHDLILLNTEVYTQVTRRKHILKRFEEKWASHPECENVIFEAWNGVVTSGSPMFQLFEKIKKCRMALVAWGRNVGNSKTKIEEKHKQLEVLTSMNTADNIELIQKVKNEIQSLLLQDELFWRQRSRSIWLSAGDKNTKYFHQRASQRRRKNHIHGFLDENGQWCTSESDTARVAEAYFQNLFTSTNPTNL